MCGKDRLYLLRLRDINVFKIIYIHIQMLIQTAV